MSNNKNISVQPDSKNNGGPMIQSPSYDPWRARGFAQVGDSVGNDVLWVKLLGKKVGVKRSWKHGDDKEVVWEFRHPDTNMKYRIEFFHSLGVTGRRKVKVNGKKVCRSLHPLQKNSEHKFKVDDINCAILVEWPPEAVRFDYTLWMNGELCEAEVPDL